jgi:hypothetical protein
MPRLIDKSPLLVVGLALVVLCTVSLGVLAVFLPDPASGLCVVFGTCMMVPGIVMVVAGLADYLLRVLPEERRFRDLVRREEQGLCTRCGYDLRGSIDRCPECGLPFNPGKRPRLTTRDEPDMRNG